MPRQKCRRATSYQPLITRFVPKGSAHSECVTLIPEEIEALYLMDLRGLYQEEAAAKMEVSRPTFARIIKTARQKVTLALLCGQALHLETKKERYTIAFCCDETERYEQLHPRGKYLLIFTVEHQRITQKRCLENPAHAKEAKPPLVLTPLFQEHDVNFFLTEDLGQGLKNALAFGGIQVIRKESLTEEEIVKLF